jgi:hypothetical protein
VSASTTAESCFDKTIVKTQSDALRDEVEQAVKGSRSVMFRRFLLAAASVAFACF